MPAHSVLNVAIEFSCGCAVTLGRDRVKELERRAAGSGSEPRDCAVLEYDGMSPLQVSLAESERRVVRELLLSMDEVSVAHAMKSRTGRVDQSLGAIADTVVRATPLLQAFVQPTRSRRSDDPISLHRRGRVRIDSTSSSARGHGDTDRASSRTTMSSMTHLGLSRLDGGSRSSIRSVGSQHLPHSRRSLERFGSVGTDRRAPPRVVPGTISDDSDDLESDFG